MKSITEQLFLFFQESRVTQSQLSRLSGVHQVYICRLRKKAQADIASRRADALREAMWELDPAAAEKALGHGRPA